MSSVCQVVNSDTCVKYQYRKSVLIWSPSGVKYSKLPTMGTSMKGMLGKCTAL